MADDLGGDDRLVAFMQYLRVLVVVLLTPLLIDDLRRRRGARRGAERGPRSATPQDWLLTAADRRRSRRSLARRANVPAGTLLGPMVVAGALTLAGRRASPSRPSCASWRSR